MPPLAKPLSARPAPVPAANPGRPVLPPATPAPRALHGFALMRTIPLGRDEWRRSTGSPFPRRD